MKKIPVWFLETYFQSKQIVDGWYLCKCGYIVGFDDFHANADLEVQLMADLEFFEKQATLRDQRDETLQLEAARDIIFT